MAKREVVILLDDIDDTESDDVETVTFGFDGAMWEIDLNKKNRDALEKALTPYLNNARKASKTTGPKSKPRTDPEQLKAMREWARANGMEVSDRGRISQEVQDAYHKAH